jgi:hypothetical protein
MWEGRVGSTYPVLEKMGPVLQPTVTTLGLRRHLHGRAEQIRTTDVSKKEGLSARVEMEGGEGATQQRRVYWQ